MSKKCVHLDVLKTFLTKFEYQLDNKPNGQCMYTFTNGLILNIYDTTGSIVFQGQETNGELANNISGLIDQINIQFD